MINFTQKIDYNKYLIAVLFIGIIFFDGVFFHWYIYHSILLSSLWLHPFDFMLFYAPKLASALILGSFVFIFKNYWWAIIVSLLLDVWMLANFIYYRANELFLNISALGMTNNMRGFWSSIETYFAINMLLPFVLTFIFASICLLLQMKQGNTCMNNKINWKAFSSVLLFGVIFLCLEHYYIWQYTPTLEEEDKLFAETNGIPRGYKTWKQFIPYYDIVQEAKFNKVNWEYIFIKDHSISQYALATMVYWIVKPKQQYISKDGLEVLNIHIEEQKIIPTSNLYIVLIESLESWVLDDTIINAMPNLKRFLNHEHVLYAPHIKSQVLQGTSGDGQMIINTGLLPIQDGAACMLYGDNTFPNYAQFYDSTYIINPCPASWNQSVVTNSYGYKQLVQRNCNDWLDDAETFNILETYLNHQHLGNECILTITIASHSPFDMVPMTMNDLPSFYPKHLRAYLNSLHYTDSCMANFFAEVDCIDKLKNATIVITGDHTIFKSQLLDEYMKMLANTNTPPHYPKAFAMPTHNIFF